MWQEHSSNELRAATGEMISDFAQVLTVRSTSRIPAQWHDAEYREAALESEIEHSVAWQVRVNREERGLSQKQLADLMETGQSAVSKLEDPAGGDFRMSTLIKAAHAFRCALIVKLVPYSEFASAMSDVRPDRLLACDFESDVANLGALRGYNSQISESI